MTNIIGHFKLAKAPLCEVVLFVVGVGSIAKVWSHLSILLIDGDGRIPSSSGKTFDSNHVL